MILNWRTTVNRRMPASQLGGRMQDRAYVMGAQLEGAKIRRREWCYGWRDWKRFNIDESAW